MRVYIGAVSSLKQYVESLDSFENIIKRDGDYVQKKYKDRGDYARSQIGLDFLAKKEYDALFLVDLDMRFKPGVLETLRSHDVDIVTGNYFKRKTNPIESVVSISDGNWPYDPLPEIPDDGLFDSYNGKPIVNTGFGNVLIKRHVVEKVVTMLPYGAPPFALGPLPEATGGDYGHFGSDYVFFYLARKAGFKIHLDANEEAEAKHAGVFWIDRKMFEIFRPHQQAKWIANRKKNFEWTVRIHGMNEEAIRRRIQLLEDGLAELNGKRDALIIQSQERARQEKAVMEQLENSILVAKGQIVERRLELESAGFKKVQLPEFEDPKELQEALDFRGKGLFGQDERELGLTREGIYKKEGMEFVDYLQEETDSSRGDTKGSGS